MIFVPVIWVSFDFRPCKKKNFEKHPCNMEINWKFQYFLKYEEKKLEITFFLNMEINV